MSLPHDYLIDRRRLRRKLSYWRIFAIAAAGAAALALFARFSDGALNPAAKLTPHIARIAIGGIITGDKATLDLVKSLGDSHASAVLVSIDSPGGTTTGAEKLHDELRRLAEKKPLVAVVGTVAASGGYIAAIAADEIVAQRNSLVGSIGVLFQFPNVGKLLDTVGVKMETVKSSPLKAAPDGFEPTSEEARAAIAALVADSYDWFKTLVKDRRKLDDEELARVTDGRVFTGRQGLPLKLVDRIGGEREAIDWLETQKGVAKGLPVVDWKKKGTLERFGIVDSVSSLARAVGLGALADTLQRVGVVAERGLLDGIVAIWQAPSPE